MQEQVVPGSEAPASGASSTKNGRITSARQSQPRNVSASELDANSVNGASSEHSSADLFSSSDDAAQLREPKSSNAAAEEDAVVERRRSGAEAGSSQVDMTQPTGPGRTVRLIRGPGGRMIRAPLAVDSGDAPLLPRQSAVRTNAGQRHTPFLFALASFWCKWFFVRHCFTLDTKGMQHRASQLYHNIRQWE